MLVKVAMPLGFLKGGFGATPFARQTLDLLCLYDLSLHPFRQ